MNQDSQPEIEGLRDRIARIIDREAFEEFYLEDGRVDQEVAAIFEDAVDEARAKASAVLALLSLKEGGGLSSSSSKTAALLASQASCSATPSSTGKEDQ